MGIALGTKGQQRAALRKAGKAAAAAILCDCQKHGLKALPCPGCGWDPLTIEAQEGNSAWHIDVLRKYLPRTHLEYRP
jgi:hypothetical protein